MKVAVVLVAFICVAQCALRSEEEAAVKAMGDPCDTVFCSLGQECVIKVSGVLHTQKCIKIHDFSWFITGEDATLTS